MTVERKKLDKQQQIIATAMTMFYQQGIHAVGINEILASSGIAKKTLYRYFESKEQLIVATLNQRHANFIHWLTALLAQESSPKAALIALFQGLDDWFNDRVELLGTFRGCYFINASAEYSQPEQPIFQVCQQHKQHIVAMIYGQTQRLPIPDADAKQLAYALAILKDGCITAAHVQDDRQAAIKVIPTVKVLINQ